MEQRVKPLMYANRITSIIYSANKNVSLKISFIMKTLSHLFMLKTSHIELNEKIY